MVCKWFVREGETFLERDQAELPHAPDDLHDVIGADDAGRVLIHSEPEKARVLGDQAEQPSEPVPLLEMLVDDHAMFRHGMEMLINREPDMAVFAQAGDSEEALARRT